MGKAISSEERLAKNRTKKQIKTTKKNLRTMSRNGKSHKARSARRVIKYGAVGFARNIWLSIASTLVMTITIVIILVTFIASAILSSTADTLQEKIDVTIFLKPGTPATTLQQMSNLLMEDKNVRQVVASTSEDVFKKFVEENKDDEVLMKALDDEEMNALMIAAMQATLRVKVYDLDHTEKIEEIVENSELFNNNIDPEYPPTYDTNRTEIDTINTWADIANKTGWILSGVFIIISILVIFNTIRMAIFSRREEIYMMRLVGADRYFITAPFVIESQISGMLAGLIATTAVYFGYKAIAPGLKDYGVDISRISDIAETQKLVLVFIGACLVGMLIGALSAELAIKKYLSRKKKR
ncbi:permease-like cell division protein FtsX [Candidatus Saccharibacteria bacterium]|nr:permease-like cell division protein FtsX [Candidatus Saccharibacteria bacterium]